jgi:glycosyltransferase involved in cell wall biosynthesis
MHVLRNDALGGLEHSTLEVARYFSSQGIEQQVVILSRLNGGISAHFGNEGIPVISIPFSKARLLPFVMAYWKNLKTFIPDVQLVSGAFGLHALLAMIARAAGVRWCWTYLIMGPATHGIPALVQTIMGQIARIFTVGEISVSGYLKRSFSCLMGLPNHRMHVIYRWRDLAGIFSLAERTRKSRTAHAPIFSTIGRLDWTKDLPNLIDAFSHFVNAEPESLFYIVGDGHLRSQLESQVAQLGLATKVIFMGHRQDVPSILGSSDIFLFSTSPTEGIGNVMIEAMASGTPMICTDTGPCREVLGEGLGGVLVPPGDPKMLSQAMLALWRDPARRARLSAQARRFANQRYTRDICGKQLMDLLFPTQKLGH